MAKVPFTKLKLKTNVDSHILAWDVDGTTYEIEVMSYLPIEKKLALISNVINKSADDKGYYNPVKIEVYFTVEAIFAYTNITFTDKQKEDVLKLYDMFVSSGLYNKVKELISEDDLTMIRNTMSEAISSVYAYQNSVVGILDTLKEDYSNLDLDATEIQEKLADSENMAFLKDILAKMG